MKRAGLGICSGSPAPSPHLCRVPSPLLWFRHQVNKTLMPETAAVPLPVAEERADAGDEQRGLQGAAEGVEGGRGQAQR